MYAKRGGGGRGRGKQLAKKQTKPEELTTGLGLGIAQNLPTSLRKMVATVEGQPDIGDPSDAPKGKPSIVGYRPAPSDWRNIWKQFGQTELRHLEHQVDLDDEHRRWLRKKNYKIGKILGRGGFGTVYEAKQYGERKLFFMKKDKTRLAVKINSLGRYRDSGLHHALDMMIVEADIVRQLDHQNVIKQIQIFNFYDKQSKFPFPIHTLLFMELMKGDLEDYIKQYGIPDPDPSHVNNVLLTEFQAREWFVQIVAGLQYLHNQDIVHLDIKLQNILYNSERLADGSEQLVFKLTDFGCSMHISKTDQYNIMYKGTPIYQPPESRKNIDILVYPADIYALGVTLMFSIAGMQQFQTLRNILGSDGQGLAAQQEFGVSDMLADLWQKMVHHMSNERPAIDELAQHQYVTLQFEP